MSPVGHPFSVLVRPYSNGDEGIVVANWARQIRRLDPFSAMSPEAFRRHVHQVVVPLLSRAPTVMACCPEEPSQVYGFICGETSGDEQVLHFLYVRSTWRRGGVATTLLRFLFPALGNQLLWFTYPARAARYHSERWRLSFNPYMAVLP